MQALVDPDGIMVGWGINVGNPPDGFSVLELRSLEAAKLSQTGIKSLLPDGTITVTPPIPLPLPPVPDYGDDAASDQAALVQAVTLLRAYLAVATPTGAQTTAALKLLIRVVLFVLKRIIGG